jgi:hypothetical protein
MLNCMYAHQTEWDSLRDDMALKRARLKYAGRIESIIAALSIMSNHNEIIICF